MVVYEVNTHFAHTSLYTKSDYGIYIPSYEVNTHFAHTSLYTKSDYGIYIPSSSGFLLCLVSLPVLVCDVARVTLAC